MKSVADPTYFNFQRNGTLVEVPGLIVHSDPRTFAINVNALCLCDIVNGEMVENPERTRSAMLALIEHSPLLMQGFASGQSMFYRNIYVKSVVEGNLHYDIYNGGVMTFKKNDYILGRSALSAYLNKSGIFPPEISNNKGTLLIPSLLYHGQVKKIKDLRAYLFSDVHSFARK